MNNLFKKIGATLAGLAMAVGVGVVTRNINYLKVEAGDTTVKTFSLSSVIGSSDTSYKSYQTSDWLVSLGGGGGSMGWNKSGNAKTFSGQSAGKYVDGSTVKTSDYGVVIASRSKLSNVNKITYNQGSLSDAKFYLTYSLDGTSYSLVNLDNNKQGTSVASLSSALTVTFSTIESAYYAIVIAGGNSGGSWKTNSASATFINHAPDVTLSTINLSATAGGTTALTSTTVKTSLTTQVYLTGNYSDNSHVDVSSSATWTTGNSEVATVSGGVITGVGVGETTISASYGGKSAVSLDLTVTQGPTFTITPNTYIDMLTNETIEKAIVGTASNFTSVPTISAESANEDVVAAYMNSVETNKVDLMSGSVDTDTNVNVTITAACSQTESISRVVEIRVKAPSITTDTNSVALGVDDNPVDVNITAIAGFANGYTVEAVSSNANAFTVELAQDNSKVTVSPVAGGSGNLSITVKNGTDRSKTIQIPVTISVVKSGTKYFIVSSNNEVFMARGLDDSYSASSINDSDNFYSTVTLTSGGYVKSIADAEQDLSTYAWTITEKSTLKYTLKNDGNKYFNIYSSGSFWMDNTQEEFSLVSIPDSVYFGLLSTETNTYLNISNNAFTTNSANCSTQFKLIEYKEFGTLDSISVDASAANTVFYTGDSFDSSGLVVTATDTAGLEKTVSLSDCTFSGYNMSSAGIQTVTVSYGGETDTYDIEVVQGLNPIEAAGGQKTTSFAANSTTFTSTGTNKSKQVDNITFTFSNITATDASYVQMATSSTLVNTATPDVIQSLKFGSVTATSTSNFSFKVYASTNGSTWVEIYSVSSISSTNIGDVTLTTQFEGNSYKYFKLSVGSGRVLRLGSVEVKYNSSVHYENKDAQTQKAVLAFVAGMNTKLAVCSNNAQLSSSVWEEVNGLYTTTRNGLTADDSMTKAQRQTLLDNMLKYATATPRAQDGSATTGDALQNALARYDYIVGKYLKDQGLTEYADFLSRNPSSINNSGALAFGFNSETNSAATFIAIIAVVSTLSVGGFFFIRKKKNVK